MTIFENLKSMNIDEFVDWFEENCLHDDDPCIRWFDETYCQNCEGAIKDGKDYAYCELNGKCRFFMDMDEVPDNKQTIKMWLKSKIKNEERECPECRYFVGCSAACKGKTCDLFIAE